MFNIFAPTVIQSVQVEVPCSCPCACPALSVYAVDIMPRSDAAQVDSVPPITMSATMVAAGCNCLVSRATVAGEAELAMTILNDFVWHDTQTIYQAPRPEFW